MSADPYHPFLSQRDYRAKADNVAAGPRQYSLPPSAPVPVPSSSTDASTWRIVVLREPAGRAGSLWLHDSLTAGGTIRVRGPRNHFEFAPWVTANCDARNSPVARLLRGVGMRKESSQVDGEFFTDEWITLDGYAILQAEHAAQSRGAAHL